MTGPGGKGKSERDEGGEGDGTVKEDKIFESRVHPQTERERREKLSSSNFLLFDLFISEANSFAFPPFKGEVSFNFR